MLATLIKVDDMSREIKFRSCNGERMQHGGFSIHATGSVLADSLHGAHPIAVMQFTGLKDKKGVEIYEGDIVSVVLIDKSGSKNQYFGKVFYQEYEFCIETDNDYWPVASWHCVYECEVIGDIYQNPELLK